MVAINFQEQFADDVEDGNKKQTVRLKARCKVGDKLQLYTGQRTKQCRHLRDAVCIAVRDIEIHPTFMKLDGRELIAGSALRDEYEDRDDDFAKKDGFSGFTEMAEWFEQRYGRLPFIGKLIIWR